jgi:hypothetical protein
MSSWLMVELADPTFSRLLERAAEQGVSPDMLARELLSASLGTSGAAFADSSPLRNLDELAALTRGMPRTDALSALDDARRELDRRNNGAA